MSSSLDLVIHCYAEQIPAFANMLTALLSSLHCHPPKCRTTVVVITSPRDVLTQKVCDDFAERDIAIRQLHLEDELLFRRAIGRNLAAKQGAADVVWFCDADYYFGQGCLDAVANLDFSKATMLYPRKAMIHVSHDAGDREIARIVPGELFTPDFSLFEEWRIRKAIGGLQIVSGDTARRGYLDQTTWTKPVTATKFLNTHCDKHFRRACGLSMPADIPNVWRFRHSESAFEGKEKRLRKAGKG